MTIIDTHCHIYPDRLALRAAEAIGHFYDTPIVFDGRVDTLLAEGGEAGITHFVVCSSATTPHQVASVNAFIAETVRAHPDVMTGLGTLHPDSPDMAGDIERLLDLGLRGVKLHPDMLGTPVDGEGYRKLFALCEGRLPVLCHFGDSRFDCTNPNRTARILRDYPNLTLIGAHLGGWSIWKEAARALAEYPNLLVDCSSSMFALTPEETAGLIRDYGAERVLFGTDYPMWRAKDELAMFSRLPLTQDEREAILFRNAARLYGVQTVEKNG